MVQAWSTFYDEVLSELPGCTTALADIAIKRAAIEFCELSCYDREDQDPVNIVAGVADYVAQPKVLEIRMIHKILRVTVDGKPIDPKSPDDLDLLLQGWRTAEGSAFAYVQSAPDRVRIVRKPAASITGGLILRVAYKPTMASTGLDDTVALKYAEAIAQGAKSRLMIQSGKPWSNPGLAAAYKDLFMAKADQARIDADRGFGRRALRTRPV